MNIYSNPQKFHKWNVPIGIIELSESKDEPVSDTEESSDSESPDVTPPLEVKITNNPVKEKSIYDECDDSEYDEIKLTKEEMDI